MIKVYHEHKGTRATMGIWLFDSWKEALPTIEAYEKYAKEYGVKYFVEIVD